MTVITLNLDPETAKIYQNFTAERQTQIQSILALIFKRTLEDETLENIITDIRQDAKANGLTPEILESLLKNE